MTKHSLIWCTTYSNTFTAMCLQQMREGKGYPDDKEKLSIASEAFTVADDAVEYLVKQELSDGTRFL